MSGWQIYDNKGHVIEKYEPFFSTGFVYAPPTVTQLGQKATFYYDPRGQVIRMVDPDGSVQRVIFGIPVDLVEPGRSLPSANGVRFGAVEGLTFAGQIIRNCTHGVGQLRGLQYECPSPSGGWLGRGVELNLGLTSLLRVFSGESGPSLHQY